MGSKTAKHAEELRPEPSLVSGAESLPGLAGGLAGHAGGDDAEVVRHASESAGKGASSDAGEKMHLSIIGQLGGVDRANVARIHDAIR
jgi:hypothetical protein